MASFLVHVNIINKQQLEHDVLSRMTRDFDSRKAALEKSKLVANMHSIEEANKQAHFVEAIY